MGIYYLCCDLVSRGQGVVYYTHACTCKKLVARLLVTQARTGGEVPALFGFAASQTAFFFYIRKGKVGYIVFVVWLHETQTPMAVDHDWHSSVAIMY